MELLCIEKSFKSLSTFWAPKGSVNNIKQVLVISAFERARKKRVQYARGRCVAVRSRSRLFALDL